MENHINQNMNNISVKVRLLGYLADELGQELSITSEANSLQGLKDLLELKHPFLKNKKYSIALNHNIETDMGKSLSESDEIALLPPFAGG